MGLGSSPRVRSGPFHVVQFLPPDGIISACAERSGRRSAADNPRSDHLRVCGAVDIAALMESGGTGSSPRVRSGPDHRDRHPLAAGIISACAERSQV